MNKYKFAPHIYKLTLLRDTENFKAGAVYIGKSAGSKYYWSGGTLPNLIVKKYGKDIFKKDIIVQGYFNEALLNELEVHYIRLFSSQKTGLNIKSGGQGGTPPDKPIYQYDLLGNYVGSFEGINSAASSCGGDYHHISKCAAKDRGQTRGFQWRHYKKEKIKQFGKMIMPVYQYDMYGNFIQEFENVTVAASITGARVEVIRDIVNGHSKERHISSGGFMWSLVKKDKLESPLTPCDIHKYDLEGNYVEGFKYWEEVLADCAPRKSSSRITWVKWALNSNTKKAHGFQWRGYKVDNCGKHTRQFTKNKASQ